ncbi:MAG: SDR family oxidoreductase [Gammaproteobacteria bacterium]|nr:SDR family oxidoreductase [Gammaproteobacteria bacterium]
MTLLDGKAAVITGTGSLNSIGTATARLFRQHGARVALLDIDQQGLTQVADALNVPNIHVTDVRNADQCREAIDRINRELGDIDILVNSAGIVYGTKVLDICGDEYEQVLDTNLRGTFHMAQAVLPTMKARGLGNIVCVSSIAGQSGGGVFGSSHYAAAKSGIFGLAKALARELAPEGIRVNAIAPGPIDNDFTHGKMTPEIKREIAAKVPLGRLGTPEDVAGACLFLASDLSSYVTGIVLDVNGGLLIH